MRVATSDGAEQLIILGHGALRLSARQLHDEVEQITGQISAIVQKHSQREKSSDIKDALERASGKRSQNR